MKWTVIGFWGGYPGAKEATSGYLLEHEGFRLLVDCGSGVLAQLQAFIGIKDIDAVILSHYHHDHVADIGPLQFARLVESVTHEKLPELPIYGHTLDQDGFNSLDHEEYTKGYAYNPKGILKIGPFSISFMETKHPVPCFAMRFEAGGDSVVYTADSSYLPGLVDFTKDASLFVSECNLYGNQSIGPQIGHMNSHDVAGIAKDAHVGQLLLTHLPHYGNHKDLAKEAGETYSGKIDLARTGWRWTAE